MSNLSKRETRLLAFACTFMGIVIGFCLAPIKKGTNVIFGNDNCNRNNHLVPKKKPNDSEKGKTK